LILVSNDITLSKKMKNQSQTLFQKDLVNEAIKQSFVKLNPKIMFKNPVMFLVEIGTVVMFIVSMFSLTGDKTQGSFSYNFLVFIILFFTVLFANFAEAIAEARGKAQAILYEKPVRNSCKSCRKQQTGISGRNRDEKICRNETGRYFPLRSRRSDSDGWRNYRRSCNH
jgi:high-affinity K+ transport system ATPase subunit B